MEVQSDFLQNVNTLIGRVVVGCDSQGTQGIEKARVVMEDGSYAITDKHGDYHFQAITNGTHVVQLDLPSLPKGYEPMSCEQNTRRAGRDYSQFVEVHGGALWRADFHVRPIPGAEGDLSLQLTQAPAADHVHNTVQLTVSDVPVNNLSTTVLLPAGMTYMTGSARAGWADGGRPAGCRRRHADLPPRRPRGRLEGRAGVRLPAACGAGRRRSRDAPQEDPSSSRASPPARSRWMPMTGR